MKPTKGKDMEVFVDAYFAGNWDSNDSQDQDTARSRHGYIVAYQGWPIIWKYQLQIDIAFYSTEIEYTGLSYDLRYAITIIKLLK